MYISPRTISQPLPGADFLAHYHLFVGFAKRRLLVTDSFRTTPLGSTVGNPITGCSIEGAQCQQVISEYADVFKPELRQHPSVPAKDGMFHHITTTGHPTYSRFRRLVPQNLTAAKTSFSEMERMGICSKSSSPCASPLHMVYKSDGGWRLADTIGALASSQSRIITRCQTSQTLQIMVNDSERWITMVNDVERW